MLCLSLILSDVNRWQDGAIVANNPTVFAIREAQLLWPDTKIDTLVSIGCGSVPTKVVACVFLHSKSHQMAESLLILRSGRHACLHMSGNPYV